MIKIRILCFCMLAWGLVACTSQQEEFLVISQGETETKSETLPEKEDAKRDNLELDEVIPKGKIMIYICGEVESPGVYELTEGSRICDAVEIAGGMTKRASKEYWNLAEPLQDGQMLFFPTVEEAKERMQAAENHSISAKDAGDVRVRINVATAKELEAVPGVGPSKAEAIIAYRQEHGFFKSAEDIMQVSGIGEALFERMRNYITVD